MEIKEILEKKQVNIVFPCMLKPSDYKILKQENIVAENDNLITGIYFHVHFRYIICCHRKDKILDYTKFAESEYHAQKLYKNMLKKIEKDLNR